LRSCNATKRRRRTDQNGPPSVLMFSNNHQVQLRSDLKAQVTLNLLSGFRAGRGRRAGEDCAAPVAARFRLRGVNRSDTKQVARAVVLLVVRTQDEQTRI